MFKSGRWNDWISLIIGDFFVGMSYGWWQHKHTRHHANPNQIGRDPDIDIDTISFLPSDAKKARGLQRWVTQRQGWLFFPLLTLLGVNLKVSSVKALLKSGAILFELKSIHEFGDPQRMSLFGSRGASLHTKAFTVDGKTGFVGSMNFDPRSASLNTEMGVLFTNAALVEKVEALFADVRTFAKGAAQSDDITAMVLRYGV